MSVFDKWNKNIDDDFVKNVEDADNGKSNYEKVPYGKYEVKIAKMELRESKTSGKPMLSIQFRILAGSNKGKIIFMGQVIETSYQVHLANEFLRSLDTDVEVKFRDYSQYNDLVLNIAEAIDEDKLEYALEFGVDDKGFDTFKILDVFTTEG